MAIEIYGNWKKGFALDLHTESSEYLGVDEFGHDKFKTKRTKVGELLYKLKYQSDKSVIPEIINSVKSSIGKIDKMDFIVPVPPSNKSRNYQPVYEIGDGLSQEYGVPFIKNALSKKSSTELKNITDIDERERILKESISLKSGLDFSEKKVLVIDDLYRSGATLRAVTSVILENGNAKNVFVLTLTKTRSKT